MTAAATQRGGVPAAPVANLPRDPLDLSPFGPLAPLLIQAINPPREDTGRPEPRVWDYPTGFNLPGGGERLIPWETLRATSTNVDVIRRCIEIRKDDVRALKWSWTVSEDAIKAAMEDGGNQAREDVEAQLRKRLAPDIARLTTFWRKPWITNGVRFGQWIARVLEDHIVCDGVAIYPVATVGGEVIAFRIVDAATIKLLINADGERPQPPFPAFQQCVQGFPRGEYIADVVLTEDGTENESAMFTASQLTYWRENLRPDSPYGYSQVEQSLVSAALYLKRQGWMHAEYDEGSTPLTWLVPAGDKFVASQLSPASRREYEQAINDDLEGQTGARHRIKISYPGFEPKQMETEAEQYKPEYDRFLVNMVIGHMGVTMDRFGLTETKGLGATGQHQRMAEVQDDSGLNPDAEMLQDIVLELSRNYLGAPPELAFVLTKDKAKDDKAEDEVADVQIKRGSMTLNEDRRRLGRPTFDFPEADMPAFYGATGPVYLEGGLERAQAQQDQAAMLAQAKANPPAPPGGRSGDQGGGSGTGGPAKPTPKPAAAPTRNKAAIADEVAAYRRWLRKGVGESRAYPARPFRFEHADPADLWEAGHAPDVGLQQFAGFEWVADPIEKSRKPGGLDWRGWNAMHPLHPRGPHGRFVRAAGLVDELKRIHGDLGEHHENALDEAARRAHAGKHFKRGDSQLADELERRGFLEEHGGKGGNHGKLEVSEAGRRHLQSRGDHEAPAVKPKPAEPKPAEAEAPKVEDARGQSAADRLRQAEVMYGSDRSKWPAHAKRDAAKLEQRAKEDAAAQERLRARWAENAPVKLPTHEEEAARVEAERAAKGLKPVSVADYRKRRAAELQASFEENDRRHGLSMGYPAGYHAESAAKIAGHETPEGTRVFRTEAGRHVIVSDQQVDDETIGRAGKALDRLNADYPLSRPVDVELGKKGDSHGSGGLGGATILSVGHGHAHSNGPDPYEANFFSPAIQGKPVVEYVTAHEYGHAHALEHGNGEEFWQAHKAGLSRYGQSDRHEGYAEAFAEWHQTEGETDNPDVRAYAEQYGWKGAAKAPTSDGLPTESSGTIGSMELTPTRQATLAEIARRADAGQHATNAAGQPGANGKAIQYLMANGLAEYVPGEVERTPKAWERKIQPTAEGRKLLGEAEAPSAPESKAPKRLPDAQHNALMTIAAKRAEHAQREDAHRTPMPNDHKIGLTRDATLDAMARAGYIERLSIGIGRSSVLTDKGHAYLAEHTGDARRAEITARLGEIHARRAELAAENERLAAKGRAGGYNEEIAQGRLRRFNDEESNALYAEAGRLDRERSTMPVRTEEDARIEAATAKADAAHEEWQAAQERFNAATDAAYGADGEDPQLNAAADKALAEEKAARDRYAAAEDELHRAGEPKRRREQAARDAEHQAAVERQQAEFRAKEAAKAKAEADAKKQAEANRARRAAEDEARQAAINAKVREMTPQVYAKLLDEPGKLKLTHEPSRKILEEMRTQGWAGVSQQGIVSVWEAPDGRRIGIYRDTAKGGLSFQDERGYILTQKDAAELVGKAKPSAPSTRPEIGIGMVTAEQQERLIRWYLDNNQTGTRRPGIARIAEGTNLSPLTVRAALDRMDRAAAPSAHDAGEARRAISEAEQVISDIEARHPNLGGYSREGTAAHVRAALDAATSREEATQALDRLNLTAPQLRQLAADLGVTVSSKDSKQRVRDTITGIKVQRRLDSQAIHPNPMRDRPTPEPGGSPSGAIHRDPVLDAMPAPRTAAPSGLHPATPAGIAAAVRELQQESGSAQLGPNELVSLTDLRRKLGGTRAEQDRVLFEEARARRLNLLPEENQKTLTEADRAAAVDIGGEPKHLVRLGLNARVDEERSAPEAPAAEPAPRIVPTPDAAPEPTGHGASGTPDAVAAAAPSEEPGLTREVREAKRVIEGHPSSSVTTYSLNLHENTWRTQFTQQERAAALEQLQTIRARMGDDARDAATVDANIRALRKIDHPEAVRAEDAAREAERVASGEVKRKIPNREPGQTKRGDVMVIERKEHEATRDGKGRERTTYEVYEVTGVTKDGHPRAVRELTRSDKGDKGMDVKHALGLRGYGKRQVIPGDQIDADALTAALKAHTYTNSTTPRNHESLAELGEALRGALHPEGWTPPAKRAAKVSAPTEPLDTTRVHLPEGLTKEQRAKYAPTAEKIDAANAALLAEPYEGPSLRGDAAVQATRGARDFAQQARDAGMVVAVMHRDDSAGNPLFTIQAVNPDTGEGYEATWHTAKGKNGSYGFMHGSITAGGRRREANGKQIREHIERRGEREAQRDAEQAAKVEAERVAADPRTPKKMNAADVQEGDWRWNSLTGWEHIAKIGDSGNNRVLYSDNYETRLGTLPRTGYGSGGHWIVRHGDRPTAPPPGEKMPTTNKAAGSGQGKA